MRILLFIMLFLIGVFFVVGLLSNMYVFHSYYEFDADAEKEWKLFCLSMSRKGYELKLLDKEKSPIGKGYLFYYSKRKRKNK